MRSLTITTTLSGVRVTRPATAGASGKMGPNTVVANTQYGEAFISVWGRDVPAFKKAVQAGDECQLRVTADHYTPKAEGAEAVNVLRLTYQAAGSVEGLVEAAPEPELVQ